MYEQMKKNNVASANQLAKNKCIRIYNESGKGIRVMFAGNSITLHGVKEDIGWLNEWGMAASGQDKDYVHLLMNEVSIKDDDAVYCVCQVSEWERNYKKGNEYYDLYTCARNFHADIIIVRFVENCPSDEFDVEIFKKEYSEFVDYLNGTGRAKIVLTSGFWKHPGDMTICEFAKERGYSFVYLGDLGERDDMKAIGLFAHNGVANHPGDKGMKAIADKISKELKF